MTNTPGVETGGAFESECWSENSDTTATETTWRMCVCRLCSSCCSATVTLKFTLTDFLHEGSLTVRQTQLIITVKWLLANYWIRLQTWCWIVFRNTDDDFTRVVRLHQTDCWWLWAAGILIRKLFAVIQHDIEHEGSNLKTTFFLAVSAGAGSIRFTCSDTLSSYLKFSQRWTFIVLLTKVDHLSCLLLINRILWCRTTAVFWFQRRSSCRVIGSRRARKQLTF